MDFKSGGPNRVVENSLQGCASESRHALESPLVCVQAFGCKDLMSGCQLKATSPFLSASQLYPCKLQPFIKNIYIKKQQKEQEGGSERENRGEK